MSNTNFNKVIFGNNTLIDLTNDDITPEDVINNKQFHMADGSITTGINTYDADTKDATAIASEILKDKTAYKNGIKLTGTMPNIGSTTLIISTTSPISVPMGFHDGGGKVKLSDIDLSILSNPNNIRKGIELLGVVGDLEGDELVSLTTVTATPSITTQIFIPPNGAPDEHGITTSVYFSRLTINPIPYTEIVNEFGGKTVIIADPNS